MSRYRCAVLLVALAFSVAGCAGTEPDSTDGSGPASTASAGTGSSSAAPTTDDNLLIQVRAGVGGEVTGDTGRIAVPLGETVHLVVESVAPDEVLVHGYDLSSPVSPFSPAELTFEATTAGAFEVELHDAGTVLLTLQVR